ncbi:hypothetical protein ACFVHR_04870 [Streptomyces sp. NPDC127168]|uniref:hypothetical protein n=1 Tax=unclassified Streptomyces TaxID=2593676 RepID=UPI003645A40A
MSNGIRLTIDGEDYTAEYEEIRFGTPRVMYEEDDGACRKLFVGPAGFHLTLVNPTARARALADGRYTTRTVTITTQGQQITHPTRFLKDWVTADGTRKVFGALAWDHSRDARWADEPQLAQA